MSQLNRRALLKTVTASTAIASLAGCSQFIPERFAAEPIGVPAETAHRLGYTSADHRQIPIQQTVPAVGEVTLVNHLIWYLTNGSDRPSPLGLVSTPDAARLGQSFNPLATLSLREILTQATTQAIIQQLLVELGLITSDFADWERQPEIRRELTAASLGDTEATIKLFVAQARATMILFALTRVTVGDTVVFVASGHSKDRDQLDENTEPMEAFSETEMDETVEEFTATLLELDEIDPEKLGQEFGGTPTQTSTPHPETPSQVPPEEIATAVDEQVSNVPKAYFAGPIRGPLTVTEPPIVADPTSVEIPGSNSTYLFIIDDTPGANFGHPMRYGWFDTQTNNTNLVDASWWPAVVDGEAIKALSFTDLSEVISGYFVGTTVFSPVSADDDSPTEKSDALTEVPRTTEEGSFNESELEDPWTEESGCFALVIDAGGAKGKGLWWTADNMAANASSMGQWLERCGCTVQRVSQYRQNSLPALKQGSPGAFQGWRAMRELIKNYGKLLTACCTTSDSTVEFFLYISTHGLEGGNQIHLHPPWAGEASKVKYSTLYKWMIESFPKCAEVTMFFDSCYSGQAISSNEEQLEKLSSAVESVAVITGTDDSHPSASGDGPDDAPTEDFLQGSDDDVGDLDGDGDTTCDLGDRFEQMKQEANAWVSPTSWIHGYGTPQSWTSGDDLGPRD